MTGALRRAIPYSLLPLSLVAGALASAPWLRAFPSAVLALPLFGAAVLSVLVPLVVVGIGVRALWLSALLDVVLLVFYELLVTLRQPVGFSALYNGLVHGPSQILTFALPLVSPRTLLVAPVALCWIAGALLGEHVARGWQSVLPYLTLLVTFGLAYAGTARAVSSTTDGRRYDTLLAAGLLVSLLLLRAAQAWIAQDQAAEQTQPEGVLPLRGLVIGAAVSIVVALAALGLGQSSAFPGRPVKPARVPPVDQSQPLTPVSFVGGVRPANPKNAGTVLFRFSTDRPTTGYVSIATVDYYDGDGWSFTRTFRPSGGVIPNEPDPTMRPPGPLVTQQYTISNGAMTTVPWMPYLNRAERVTGMAVNIDPVSGMIVPSRALHAGDQYTVRSTATSKDFADLSKSALLGTSAAQVDTTLPNGLGGALTELIGSLAQETGASSDQPIPFLQAVAKDFRTNSALAGGPPTKPSSTAVSAGRFAQPEPARPSKTPKKSPAAKKPPTRTPSHATPTPSPTSTTHTGGTTFADVLASIRASHSATPEQYATLTALIARKLGVPARVVAGFRIKSATGSTTLPAGSYEARSADAWTWVEIPVRGLGWVVLDPSPQTYSGPAQQNGGGSTPSATPSPTPTGNALVTHANNGHAVAPRSKTPHDAGLSVTTVLAVVLIVILALIAVIITILLARKRVRVRRRRRAGDPRRRLLGAWQESLDVLTESGLPELTYLTSAEVAAATGERFGGEPAAQVRYIGDAANVALFSPTSWIGPAEADAAWRAQAVLSQSVRRRLGWRNRIGAGLRYNRTKRRRPRVGPTSWAAAARARATGSSRGKHVRPRRSRDTAG